METTVDSRNGEVIVVMSDNGKISSTFAYLAIGDKHVYYFNGFELYKDTVKYMLSRRQTTFIPVYSNLTVLIRMMQLVNSVNDTSILEENKQQFMRYYLHYHETEVVDDVSGQEPLLVLLIICIDREQFKADITSAEFISVQQVCRMISLMHGGSVVVTNNVYNITKDRISTTSLLKTVGLLDNEYPEPEPLFKEVYMDLVPLFIPRGWDSWNKIVLLAKSIYYDPEASSYMLFTDPDPQSITSTYISCLNQKIPISVLLELIVRQ